MRKRIEPLNYQLTLPLLGTFSTVYKAEDMNYDRYQNDWDVDPKATTSWQFPPVTRRTKGVPQPHTSRQTRRKNSRYVAIKKIYVTSSPARIQNELELLHELRGCESVCPLITAFRHQDQVVAVLPYFRHQDFRVWDLYFHVVPRTRLMIVRCFIGI